MSCLREGYNSAPDRSSDQRVLGPDVPSVPKGGAGMSADRLLGFLASHGVTAYAVAGRIIAVGDCSGITGVTFAEVTTIEPTLMAVRDWLGY